MKYGLFLKLLRSLIYIKRFFWWIGSGADDMLAKIVYPVWQVGGYLYYKINYLFKKAGIEGLDSWTLNRKALQLFFFFLLMFIAIPETKFYVQKSTYLAGQNTIAYAITGPDEEYGLQEIIFDPSESYVTPSSDWRQGAVQSDQFSSYSQGEISWQAQNLSAAVAGGSALSRPMISPQATVAGKRREVIQYVVGDGDSLSSIAFQFGVSVATIMWENNLSLRSIIRPNDTLHIPPVTGVIHKVKRGDTLKKIASLYEAKIEDIVKFNKLKDNGSDLLAGESIVIPEGVKPQARSIARVPRTLPSVRQVAAPPRSLQRPSLAGFVWPTSVRLITQYFSWRHHALDIAGGNLSTPIYASKTGTVEISQCGWNRGYGCYVVVNHGGGVKTLYGHNSKLLVSSGDHVDTGQTIALMGNTGRVRGRTGIHTHFEIQMNGVRVNPLGYVR
ncbi:MAG: Peptidase M23 family protein [Candidatus Magasanikbacteria bacterium GW2011_GWA2_46_17]|uniref:Peptidase M23 family protein n=1 Tax=Candidatus Magasanikbacteria bacterium GW2011_GWA2_46_17 TaxID=1619042 RepID=A0A0G1NYA5_9BACT|nr:MAG: Peptidase M23 family protein [Candidatus Magasanikbacteria bacterium GW2011_GWA2_46_17]